MLVHISGTLPWVPSRFQQRLEKRSGQPPTRLAKLVRSQVPWVGGSSRQTPAPLKMYHHPGGDWNSQGKINIPMDTQD